MGLVVHVINGRLIRGVHGCGGIANPSTGYFDLGPYAETRKDRALMAMQRMEQRGQTGRRLYDLARRIAIREIWGI